MERSSTPLAVTIAVNGAARPAAAGAVQSLIFELGLDAEAVAVERNREIVKRSDWDCRILEDGDTIEIVHFVGGG